RWSFPPSGRVMLGVGLIALLLWHRRESQPMHEGTVRVSGLDRDVRIERDAQGIPQIVAASERDAAFGLGYAHGQDRLWQMEFNRRLAAGRLAEVLGPSALPTDQFPRPLGVLCPRKR